MAHAREIKLPIYLLVEEVLENKAFRPAFRLILTLFSTLASLCSWKECQNKYWKVSKNKNPGRNALFSSTSSTSRYIGNFISLACANFMLYNYKISFNNPGTSITIYLFITGTQYMLYSLHPIASREWRDMSFFQLFNEIPFLFLTQY